MKIPKLKYCFEQDWVVEKCLNKRVLHLGCAGDATLKYGLDASMHYKISQVASVLDGVELNYESLNLVKQMVPENINIRYFKCNVENLSSTINDEYDVIVAGSIIEHLSNPGLMLESISKIMHDKTLLLIITPHVWGVLQIIRVVFSKNESVNPEHTCWFSIPTLNEVCSRYDLVPIEFCTGYSWKPQSIKWFLKKNIGILFFKLFPHLGGSLFGIYKIV